MAFLPFSRRVLLAFPAGFFGVDALFSPIEPSADPIFAAIKAAQDADAHLTACLDGLNEDDEAAMGLADEATDLSSDAMGALRSVVPTTASGFHALIRHYAADAALDDPYSVGAYCLAHLAACLPDTPS